MFERLGRFIFRNRWATLAACGGFLVLSLGLLLRGGPLSTGHIRVIEAERAQARAAVVLGHPLENTFVVAFQSDRLGPDDDDFQTAMDAALAPLQHDPRVLSVVTADDAPAFLADQLTSSAAHTALALVTVGGDEQQALAAYPRVRAELRSEALHITCTGQLPFTSDLNRTLEKDLLFAELISLPLALLVLLWVFRSAVAAALPVGVGGLAVVGGIGLVMALSHVTDIAEYTVNVCSLIGLGVAIDYSLFIVSRYREELACGRSYEDALARAVSTAGRVVAFSGAAVGTGLVGLLFFERSYLSAMGLGGAIVVALAALAALTFLPALLAVLGPRIDAGRLPWRRVVHPAEEGAWHAVAHAVMRRPLVVLVPTLAVLLVMGAPFLHLRLARADVRVLTHVVEARRGYDLLRRDFPALARTRDVVVVDFPGPVLTRERIGALYDLSRRIAKLPGVVAVQSLVDDPSHPGMSKAAFQATLLDPPPMFAQQIEKSIAQVARGNTTLLYVLVSGDPDGEQARRVVRELRAVRAVGDGTLMVGGDSAADLDATAYVRARVPRAMAFVIAVTMLMLFLLLGSAILPVKAVLMNLVSITGSFGALVWVFQDGHLFVREPRPIEPSLPVLLFCVVFGLSMDYEVLMLSRMKEAFERTGDNTASVAEGLERSAGLITSAAAIMVCVFGAFSLARVIVVQAVGFGMALAVAVDATLVRVVLVPATMRLFGDLNWWAPRFMLRLQRALGFGRPRR